MQRVPECGRWAWAVHGLYRESLGACTGRAPVRLGLRRRVALSAQPGQRRVSLIAITSSSSNRLLIKYVQRLALFSFTPFSFPPPTLP